MQVDLKPLDILSGGHDVVAPEQASPEPGRDDEQGPLEHRIARGLGACQFHPLDVDLVLAVGDRLEIALFDFRFGEIIVELREIDVVLAVVVVSLAFVFHGSILQLRVYSPVEAGILLKLIPGADLRPRGTGSVCQVM